MIPRNVGNLFVGIYVVALLGFAVICLALLGVVPLDVGVEGLSDMQALGVTLALMAVIGLRLAMHFRMRRAPRSDAPPPPLE